MKNRGGSDSQWMTSIAGRASYVEVPTEFISWCDCLVTVLDQLTTDRPFHIGITTSAIGVEQPVGTAISRNTDA